MSRRTPRYNHASRAVLALAMFVSIVIAPSAASAQPRLLDQQWQVQGMLVGDAGSSQQSVTEDALTLEFGQGSYRGLLSYGDVLGFSDGSGTYSQVSQMRLQLTGTPLEGGKSAGGTFGGTVTLTQRDAKTLAEAASPNQLALSSGDQRTYDVTGHWGARISGGTAQGELLFQTAHARSGGSGQVKAVSWFNRATGDFADPLGSAQTFSAPVTGASVKPGSRPGGASGSTPASTAARLSVLDYIVRGLSGRSLSTPVPVTSAQAEAARALRDAAPSGAAPLPAGSLAIDLDVAGAYLDAKNRAAGLLGDAGPLGVTAEKASAEASSAREAVPGRPAPADGEDVGLSLARRLASLLDAAARAGVAGAQSLRTDAAAIAPGADAETVMRLRAFLATAEAFSAGRTFSASAPLAEQVARTVASTPVPASGPLADAVLAAADSPKAPVSATVVTRFERAPSADASGSAVAAAPSLPGEVFARLAAAGQVGRATIGWESSAGPQQVSPASWLAYRRADGRTFWLAGDAGPVALSDGSLRGWAWSAPRASLVESDRAGSVLALFDLR